MTVKELKEFLDTLPEDAIVCNRHMLGGGSEIIYIQENEDKFTIYSTPYNNIFGINDNTSESYIDQIKKILWLIPYKTKKIKNILIFIDFFIQINPRYI